MHPRRSSMSLFRPDIVVINLIMEDRSSYTLCRYQLRRSQHREQTPCQQVTQSDAELVRSTSLYTIKFAIVQPSRSVKNDMKNHNEINRFRRAPNSASEDLIAARGMCNAVHIQYYALSSYMETWIWMGMMSSKFYHSLLA